MKKFLALIVSALLAVTLFAFAGCGNEGVVSGNYKEVTADELKVALDDVDATKISEGLKGYEIASKFDVQSNGSTALVANISLNDKTVYDENNDLKGNGTLSLNFKYGDDEFTANGNSYISDGYVYTDTSGKTNGEEQPRQKLKFEYGGVLDYVKNLLPVTFATTSTSGTFDSIIQLLNEYSIKVSMDNSNGLKLKLSFTEDTIKDLLAELPVGADTGLMQFNKFLFDVYFALDSEGRFSQLSLNTDIDITARAVTLQSSAEPSETTIKLTGYIAVKSYNGAVKVPDGLSTDPSYVDQSFLINNILGGGLGY